VSLAAYGLEVSVPAGWVARIYARPLARAAAIPAFPSPFARRAEAHGGTATLHAASFALPAQDAEFGTTATESMPRAGAFLALVEYEAGAGLEPGVGLFSPPGPPGTLGAGDFAPETMLRPRPGQVGAQRFFTASGRPFCLYAVLRGGGRAGSGLGELNRMLGSLRIAELPKIP
jgi:hypothetical protein